ncbi:hypothetical protein SSS_10818 [Sarcoptes scabiei]|nr:hypothetical protein SSS_10818 [Sarcoptes scabiei]
MSWIFLTKIKSNKNERWRNVISLDEIFDERNGTIVESIHFSYLYDIEWLIEQYPSVFRNNPIYIVYGRGSQMMNSKFKLKHINKSFFVLSSYRICSVRIILR